MYAAGTGQQQQQQLEETRSVSKMVEELDLFIEAQRAKLAKDKAELEKDPPYMEIRSKRFEDAHDVDQPRTYASKENIPPNRQMQRDAVSMKPTGDISYGLSLPLGEDYERKKHKLKEELRQDYRRYISQKHVTTTGEVNPATHGMSLPIGERLSAKDKLRLERNREYNQFLRMKEEEQDMVRRAAATEAAQYTQRDKTHNRVKPEQYAPAPVSYREQDVPKRDAYSSMEAYEQLLNKRRSEAEKHYRRDGQTVSEDPFVRKPGVETTVLNKKLWRDVDTDVIDRPHHNAADWELERIPLRLSLANDDDENASRIYTKKYNTDVQDRRPLRNNLPHERVLPPRGDLASHDYQPDQASYFQMERSDHRPDRGRRIREPPVDYEDDFREPSNRRPISSISRSRPKMDIPVQPPERSKSANVKDENFSTSLLLGGEEKGDAQKRRKENYRQELMEQMAEQQRNKRREKELELKVAASGAIDPEKQPDRLRQFGAINRQQEMTDRNVPYRPGILLDPQKTSRRVENKPVTEERAPPERPRVAFQTPLPEPALPGNGFSAALNAAHDEYHRGLSSALGEIVAPRLAVVPPPNPPVLADNYRTPYDDAYYYYGARNPLDPNLAYYPPGMLSVQTGPGVGIPAMHSIQTYPENYTVDNKQKAGGGRGASLGAFPEERPRQTRDAVLSYQEQLEQQIRETNERRRKEKEERERIDAKLEADVKNYNPWGKGGGGAPLRDTKGNLITDLKRMHKQNEEVTQNPEDKRAVLAMDTSLADNTTPAGKIPGFSFANNSQFASGSVISPNDQQVQQQESYKNFLRQQIEEKRRKEEEERERIRLEEEREEKRLAEQRAKLQQEYLEEKNKKKLKEEEQQQKNEELVRLASERRKEAERKMREEEAKHEEELKRFHEKEKAAAPVVMEQERSPRPPSPVIPALQHKLSTRTQRPPTAESEVSIESRGEPRSRTVSPPVPARRNQLRAYDEKKNVISELSELRKQLRSEQRRLESRLQDADRDESLPSMSGRKRGKNSADVFEMARQRLQATVRRPSLKGIENVNMQNIREFNDLKYRDTDTREGVRYMYPDPPKDDQTLEIQQQALLREQLRNLNKMKRRTAMPDDTDNSEGVRYIYPDPQKDGQPLEIQQQALLREQLKNLNKMKRRTVLPDDLEPVPTHGLQHPGRLKDPLNTSMLESESTFIGEDGEPYTAIAEPLPSARERRRHKHNALDFDNEISPVPPLPLHQPDRFSVNSASSFNVDELQTRNEERLRRLNNLQKSRVSIDDSDGFGNAEDILQQYPTKANERPHSVDTVATEPWMRPGTSETLKRFMAGQTSQDRLTNDNALTFNWQGLSTAHG
ncbi:centrosome and spindle pole-associated protein 1 isoform X2 [Pseudophryne corroboree]|uniref:centrosome and spindle pole-associated protein 1 isoform X2 n=1 Tax=Pseudophryne corroboree TaxID=495146 RepID=UPI0030816DFF